MAQLYSPLEAVYGHDRTHVRRLTLEEYLAEVAEEEEAVRAGNTHTRGTAEGGGKRPEYERRRSVLAACNDGAGVATRFPLYDRAGRELCLAHQLTDMMVQAEARRVGINQSSSNNSHRRSGVRLSSEILTSGKPSGAGGDATQRDESSDPSAAAAAAPPPTKSARLESRGGGGGGGGGMAADSSCCRYSTVTGTDVVSASVSRASSYRVASARPSEFSIYRDSAAPSRQQQSQQRTLPLVPDTHHALQLRRGPSHPAVGENTDEEGAAPQEQPPYEVDAEIEAQLLEEYRAKSLPPPLQISACSRAALEARSASQPPPPPSSTVTATTAAVNTSSHAAPPAAGALPPLSPPPPPAQQQTQTQTQTQMHTAAQGDRSRPTVWRDSALRATKQLFRHGTTTVLGRATHTVVYRDPITIGAGVAAGGGVVRAGAVAALVNANIAAGAPLSHEMVEEPQTPAPELRCGEVVRLGGRHYRILRFYVVAEVYEAVEVPAPARHELQQPQKPDKTDGDEEEAGKQAAEGQLRATEECPPLEVETEAETEGRLRASEVVPPARAEATTTAAGDEGKQANTNDGGDTGTSAAAEDADDAPAAPVLLYRWRSSLLPHGGEEARRAALGLALWAPEVRVRGFRFADRGLTLVELPPGYAAVPLSGLPMRAPAFATCVRLLLRALSTAVSRRTVHGNLCALGEVFMALPTRDASGATPLLLPTHWERFMDFNMFADRAVGRTVLYDAEDGVGDDDDSDGNADGDKKGAALISYTRDVRTLLTACLPEHPLYGELPAEARAALEELRRIAEAHTQVANCLVQIKNVMVALPTDMPALLHAHECGVSFYGRQS